MIYILEFSRPLHHARYYVGYCDDDRLQDRIKAHNDGRGAAITRAARLNGITLQLVMTLPGDRARERQIKRQKNTPRLVRRHLKCDASAGAHVSGAANVTASEVTQSKLIKRDAGDGHISKLENRSVTHRCVTDRDPQ